MSDNVTPMIRQYLEIKSRYKDAILFYRLGDFYEMFYEDAQTASKILDLTLTGRGEGANRMPMCGIPYHASAGYISKLISKGFKVAICEQLEDPKAAIGVVKRDVIKVITPGTVQEDIMLDAGTSNYLLSISFSGNIIGLSYLDASTGEFKITKITGEQPFELMMDEIKRISPAEILIPDIIPENAKKAVETLKHMGTLLTTYKDIYDPEIASKKIKNTFKLNNLDSFGLSDHQKVLGCSVAILDYLETTQRGSLSYINSIKPYTPGDFMYIDQATRRNLELVTTIRENSSSGSLVWVLDQTRTPMGSRLLKKWISQPLVQIKNISDRHDAVGEFYGDLMHRMEISEILSGISDIERISSRIASGACNARDLVGLKLSLSYIPKLKAATKKCNAKLNKKLNGVEDVSHVHKIIDSSIVDVPPLVIKDGGLIKQGYDAELDEIRKLTTGGKEWIAELELKERTRTGIKSLKVGFTSVFGYYIEVSKANLELVPADYIRKQTLVNCERFVTPELKEKEALIMNAEERAKKLEYEIFCRVRAQVAEQTILIKTLSEAVSELDAVCSLADVASKNKYVKPVMTGPDKLSVKSGRHPVVERTMSDNKYIPNDTEMSRKDNRFMLITGPNMAGKSTYMRQVALICLMAQAGSFVPAENADLPILDRIFTRIGAMDDIYSGQSTFMVEMTETANILNNATKNSLVILDEIGRGTSTFDGMSIAAAVSEYIHETLGAYTMFATHYHEITQMASSHKGMSNYNTLVKKEGDSVIFLHKIVKGSADQSYGIEVARLAGLPENVIKRAKEIYETLAMVETDMAKKTVKKKGDTKDQMGMF